MFYSRHGYIVEGEVGFSFLSYLEANPDMDSDNNFTVIIIKNNFLWLK